MTHNNLSIIVLAHNEKEYAKNCIESIRLFSGDMETDVILVDNGSTDSLDEWASQQEDITFIRTDNGMEGWGSVLNQVISILDIKTDFLVIGAKGLITPLFTERMLDVLYLSNLIATVACSSNGLFSEYQHIDLNNYDYERAVEYSVSLDNIDLNNEAVIVSDPYAVLYKKQCFDLVGGFDVELSNINSVTIDCQLRLLKEGFKTFVSSKALLFSPCEKLQIPDTEADDSNILRKKWGMHYFNLLPGNHLISMIRCPKSEPINVLEIGCDCGATLWGIKKSFPNSTTYGVEINEAATKIANCFTEAIVGNIEDENLPYEKNSMDYIIFGDVLEHLRNPEKTILYIKSILKKDGYIIANIPNLMHISVIDSLLHGNFTYTETGLLDKTHIHFFTYNEIVKMFNGSGYKIIDIKMTLVPLPDHYKTLENKLINIVNDSNVKPFMFEAFQYLILAQKQS